MTIYATYIRVPLSMNSNKSGDLWLVPFREQHLSNNWFENRKPATHNHNPNLCFTFYSVLPIINMLTH